MDQSGEVKDHDNQSFSHRISEIIPDLPVWTPILFGQVMLLKPGLRRGWFNGMAWLIDQFQPLDLVRYKYFQTISIIDRRCYNFLTNNIDGQFII